MMVKTKHGMLRGYEDEQIAVFKGIPYAKPPVGDLRWKAPQPAEDWVGVKPATEFGPASAQPTFSQNYAGQILTNDGPKGEDCLYLNIWTPKKAVKPGHSLPVLFIIHGGGFKFFSGATSAFDGLELAKKDIVVVTINYRLGVMGFFAHPELSSENPNHVSGNYGILDQIAALQWVHDNIASFGGDPDQITICGESAGAFSISVLYSSPLAKGLFCRATAQSGGFMDRETVMYKQMMLHEAEDFFSGICNGKNLAELRRMSADELIEMTASVSFTPVRDNYVFQYDNKQAIKEKCLSDIPLLIGSNCDEGTLFADQSGNSDTFAALAMQLVGADKMPDFLKLYPNGNKEETVRSQIQLNSDNAWGHNMYTWAKLHSNYSNNDAYLYYYCHVPPGSDFGAHHSSEIVYFHHNLRHTEKAWTKADFSLEEALSSYLVNFIKTGNPNGEGLTNWIPFGEDEDKIMVIEDEPCMAPNPTLQAMRFWDANEK